MVVEPSVPAIVPSHGSMSRRALRSTGSLGKVPPLRRYYDALRLPAAPLSLACACDLQFRRFRVGAVGISQVPRRPSPHMPRLSDSGGILGAGLREQRPYASPLRCCLPGLPDRRLPRHRNFGVQFRSPRARCLRFVTRVTLGRHARLASDWRPCLGRAGI